MHFQLLKVDHGTHKLQGQSPCLNDVRGRGARPWSGPDVLSLLAEVWSLAEHEMADACDAQSVHSVVYQPQTPGT